MQVIETLIDLREPLRDCIVALSAVVAAAYACKGIGVWRDELRGRSRYEVARRLMLAVYRVRQAVEVVRASVVTPDEYPEGWRGRTGDKLQDYRNDAHVFRNRWSHVVRARGELDEIALEAELYWGGNVRCLSDALWRSVHSLWIAHQRLLASTAGTLDLKGNQVTELRERAYGCLDGEDAVDSELGKHVQAFEQLLRPALQVMPEVRR